MEIKKFKNFTVNENSSENDFRTKLIEDYDVQQEAKSIITIGLEKISSKLYKVTNFQEFLDTVFNIINIDETNMLDFDIDRKIDLCIISEDDGFGGCPETSWEQLLNVINNSAIGGLDSLVREIIKDICFENLEQFMADNGLNYSDISSDDTYSYAAPKMVKSIKNGELYQYRKLDGEIDVDVYIYNGGLGVDLYINKKL